MNSNRVAMIEAYSWKAFLYYALFPLDLYRHDSDDQLGFMQYRMDELVPILGWVVPVLVLIAMTTTSLNFIGFVLFFAVEAALLAIATKFHLKLAWNQVVELWLNLWASLLLVFIAFSILAFALGVVTNPDVEWDDD
jgi:hypothetical protein